MDQELRREREKLSHFDEELKSLDRTMKEKKQATIDAEIALQKFEHDVQAITKEKASAINNAANLVKQYPWIADELECVLFSLGKHMSSLSLVLQPIRQAWN